MLDDDLVNRAVPPGSLRYFSLLYAPPAQRETLTALLAVETEIRESAHSANHDVAHTRLRWWRMEVDRLTHGQAQHPAMRVLAASGSPPQRWSLLHELLSAADMDLARLRYQTLEELNAYCARSGGAPFELAARQLLGATEIDIALGSTLNRIGGALRQIEILRDVRQDGRAGRQYLPLDLLQRHGVAAADLQQSVFAATTQAALREFAGGILQRLDAALAAVARTAHAWLRPLLVNAALHRRLLQRMTSHVGQLATERIELGPLEKPWIAWRAAVRAS